MTPNKVAIFTVADENNMQYALGLKNSLEKFHPDLELIIFGEKEIKETGDPEIFYRATPYFGLYLMQQGYKTVIKLDADQIITGDISHVWEEDFDIGTVHNSNPRELKKIMVTVQGVDPMEYQNCGFIVMKDIEFVKQWLALCMSPRFQAFQFREQDILNNMIFWGRWRVKFLDNGPKWHGLIARGFEPNMQIIDGKLMLLKNEIWPKEDRQIVCWHNAGGNMANKMNVNILFNSEVSKWLQKLTR
jgi:hypothetical protein